MDSPSSSSPDAISTPGAFESSLSSNSSTASIIQRALELALSGDPDSQLVAAKEIRRLTKTSHRCRRLLNDAIIPLVSMLRKPDFNSSHESALLALLNLAVKDDRNKSKIVKAGALDPIIGFLKSKEGNLQEHATAMVLTLSASSANKMLISSSGAVPLLVEILQLGTLQARIDSIVALSNLIGINNNLSVMRERSPVAAIATLLKTCKKSSKAAEKGCLLMEALMAFEDCRVALTKEEGGVLGVVEVLESGTPQGRENAASALLAMCESDRSKYREPILKEGVIPGLLELTVQGSATAQQKAQSLLRLLRENAYPRTELQADTLENIVSRIMSDIEGDEQCSKAKKMLAEMVQVSMEQSLRHLQRRALVCTSGEFSVPSEVRLK